MKNLRLHIEQLEQPLRKHGRTTVCNDEDWN